MLRMIVRRVAVSVLMLAAISILIFVVLRLLPGDPIITRLGASASASPEALARLRAQAGLDDPIIVQYWHWISGAVHGDFGQSYFNTFSVGELISQRLPETIELTILSVVLAVVIAVPSALVAVRRPGGVVDRIVTTGASAGMAFPQFIVGITLIVIFAVKLRAFPSRGYVPISQSLVYNLHDMLLPSLTLAVAAAPLLIRHLRASLLEVLDMPYIRTATGKGVSQRRVLTVHALGNATVPTLTMLGMIVGYTLGGAVIVEYIFGLPGLGSLAVNSVMNRDYAVLQSAVLLISGMFIVTNLVVDILIGVVDPRLRIGARNG